MGRYWIETYGCQMNKAESSALIRLLQARGWQAAPSPAQAELVVLNTCSVRKTAEDRLWGRLGAYKSLKREGDFRLVLMGCMAERLKERILEQAPQVDLLVGNFQKHRLMDLIEQPVHSGCLEPGHTGGGQYRFSGLHHDAGFRALLPIMHGCNNFCTYCVVPYVRGPELSRSVQSIRQELSRLEAASVREITLLGQNVNSYCTSQGTGGGEVIRFPRLLEMVAGHLKHIRWIRFLTSHPKDFSQELIEVIVREPALCRHIHLPVQHGSDRILERMGRGYTRDQYLGLVESLKKRLDEFSLTTDILIGFPGETEEDLRQTLQLMEAVEFDEAFTYRYNPRAGTRAFAWGDSVMDGQKRERLNRVIGLQRKITRKKRQRKLGRQVRVLVEGVSRKNPQQLLGRTELDEMVVFPASEERIGNFIRVELVSLAGNTLVGKEVSGSCPGR